MTEEEKTAKKLQDKIDLENKSKEGVESRMGIIETMMKSLVDKAKDEEPFDYSTIDPVDMAKSMADDPEGQKEFLDKFIENSHVNAVDLVDENGFEVLTEEMRKSIEEGESQGAQILGAILQTMEANNKLGAIREGALIAGMAQMAKSFSESEAKTTEKLEEMKKSIAGDGVSDIEGEIQSAGSSEIGGGEDDSVEQNNTEVFAALKKSFLDGKPQAEQARYYDFAQHLSDGYTHDQLRATMESNELEVFESNL